MITAFDRRQGHSLTVITNRGAWLQIAAALDKHPNRDLFDHARRVAASSKPDAAATSKRSAGAAVAGAALAINFGGCVAPSTSVPDGNHGDNFDEVRA